MVVLIGVWSVIYRDCKNVIGVFMSDYGIDIIGEKCVSFIFV